MLFILVVEKQIENCSMLFALCEHVVCVKDPCARHVLNHQYMVFDISGVHYGRIYLLA